MLFFIRLCSILILIAFALSFSIGNTQDVTIAFPPLSYTFTLPLHIALYSIFSGGVFAGLLTSTIYYKRKMMHTHRALKQVNLEKNALQQQITTEKTEQFAQHQLIHAPTF
jgi:uncharacterized membrane protein YciS (DUF1049 family)